MDGIVAALGAVGAIALLGEVAGSAARAPGASAECPVPMDGNAQRGQRILDGYAARSAAARRGTEPLADYGRLWDRGRAEGVKEMAGYAPGGHRGVVAQLRDWVPDLSQFDIIILNSSAGKDSLAMMAAVTRAAEAQGVRDRLVVVHADLGDAEHPGVQDLARAQADRLGLPFHVVAREVRGVRRDLLERFVENMRIGIHASPRAGAQRQTLQRLGFAERGSTWSLYAETAEEAEEVEAALRRAGMRRSGTRALDPGHYWAGQSRGFPGHGTRYCTSEFKTAEVAKWVTDWVRRARARGELAGRPARILHTLDLRAEESDSRAKRGFGWKNGTREKSATRNQELLQWLPIQLLSDQEVWDVIAATGLPWHRAYAAGFDRLSCRMCPLAGDTDVALAILTYPQLADRIRNIERRYGHRFKETRGVDEILKRALQLDPSLPEKAARARSILGHERVRAELPSVPDEVKQRALAWLRSKAASR